MAFPPTNIERNWSPKDVFDYLEEKGDEIDDFEPRHRFIIASKSQAGSLLGSKSRGKEIRHAVSIRSPDSRPPYALKSARRNVLELYFDDIALPCDSPKAPQPYDVEELIKWGEKALKKEGYVMTHCQAGVSRSTAAAFILSAMELGFDEDALEAAKRRMMFVRPQAAPNYAIISHADQILGLDGLMLDVLEEVFRTDSRIKHIFA